MDNLLRNILLDFSKVTQIEIITLLKILLELYYEFIISIISLILYFNYT